MGILIARALTLRSCPLEPELIHSGYPFRKLGEAQPSFLLKLCMTSVVSIMMATVDRFNAWLLESDTISRYELVRGSVSLEVGFGVSKAQAIPSVSASCLWSGCRTLSSSPSRTACEPPCSWHADNELKLQMWGSPSQTLSSFRVAMVVVSLHSNKTVTKIMTFFLKVKS